jgi:hypothetical protein
MKRLGIRSDAELARLASTAAGYKITRQMVHKWKNSIAYPSQQNREALAEVFRIPVADLTIQEVAGRPPESAPLSPGRVPFRYTSDPHNPALVRAEMSDLLTREQAEKIAALLRPAKTSSDNPTRT